MRCYADGMPDKATEAEARQFAVAFRAFLDWIRTSARDEERNEIGTLLADFLGAEAAHSVVTRELPPLEHVNLQTALDAWCARPGRTVDIRGITVPPHFEPPNLQQLVAARSTGPVRLAAPALADLPNGPGSTLGCLRSALLLVTDALGATRCSSRDQGSIIPALRSRSRGCRSRQPRASCPNWTRCAPS